MPHIPWNLFNFFGQIWFTVENQFAYQIINCLTCSNIDLSISILERTKHDKHQVSKVTVNVTYSTIQLSHYIPSAGIT